MLASCFWAERLLRQPVYLFEKRNGRIERKWGGRVACISVWRNVAFSWVQVCTLKENQGLAIVLRPRTGQMRKRSMVVREWEGLEGRQSGSSRTGLVRWGGPRELLKKPHSGRWRQPVLVTPTPHLRMSQRSRAPREACGPIPAGLSPPPGRREGCSTERGCSTGSACAHPPRVPRRAGQRSEWTLECFRLSFLSVKVRVIEIYTIKFHPF